MIRTRSKKRRGRPEVSVDYDARRSRDVEISDEVRKLGVAHRNMLVLEATIAMLEANLGFLVNPAISGVTRTLRRELRREARIYARQMDRIRAL